MFKCKAKHPAPTTEEDLDTMQVTRRVSLFYDYVRRKGYEGTLEEFVDEVVRGFFNICAWQKGIQLVEVEETV